MFPGFGGFGDEDHGDVYDEDARLPQKEDINPVEAVAFLKGYMMTPVGKDETEHISNIAKASGLTEEKTKQYFALKTEGKLRQFNNQALRELQAGATGMVYVTSVSLQDSIERYEPENVNEMEQSLEGSTLFLFSLEGKYKEYLKAGPVETPLKVAFFTNGYPVSEIATMSGSGNRWKISQTPKPSVPVIAPKEQKPAEEHAEEKFAFDGGFGEEGPESGDPLFDYISQGLHGGDMGNLGMPIPMEMLSDYVLVYNEKTNTVDVFLPKPEKPAGSQSPKDPPCRPVFTVTGGKFTGKGLDSMKRTNVYNQVSYTGIKSPFEFANRHSYRDYKMLEPTPLVPPDYTTFAGKIRYSDITARTDDEAKSYGSISSKRNSVPTPSPNSMLVGDPVAIDVTTEEEVSVKFTWDKNLDMWFLNTRDGKKHDVDLAWSVACPNLFENYWRDPNTLPEVNLPIEGVWIQDSLDGKCLEIAQQMLDIQPRFNKYYGLKSNVVQLTEYCRAYKCPVDAVPNADMGVVTFKKQVGACRQRAIDFFLIANKIGIPCRYATSDCHAWVEVYDPAAKQWLGINLGGCRIPEVKDKNPDAGGAGDDEDDDREELNPIDDTIEKPEIGPDFDAILKAKGVPYTQRQLAKQIFKRIGGK